MAITDANTNTNQTLPYLPSLRPPLASAQPERASENLPKPQVQDPVLGSATEGEAGLLSGERVRGLIAARTGRIDFRKKRTHANPFSHRRLADRLINGIDSATDGSCWEWVLTKDSSGYGSIGMYNKRLSTHRVSYEVAHGPIPRGMMVLHSCDNHACVNPEHLHLGTHKDNVREAHERNRYKSRGALNSNAKLSEGEAYSIKQLRLNGVSGKEVAKRFNVSERRVWDISTGRSWRHIQVA